jgi:hypothetical protein
MIGSINESGDGGKYLQWNGATKPRCGGLGFSFNDSLRARHNTKKGTWI